LLFEVEGYLRGFSDVFCLDGREIAKEPLRDVLNHHRLSVEVPRVCISLFLPSLSSSLNTQLATNTQVT
jgi:hypothetical protein